MKKLIQLTLCLTLTFQLFGQIPDLQIKDTSGTFFNLPDYLESDQNYALIFWSAQDAPSTGALEDYHNYYSDWLNDFNIEFLIISIDEENIHDDVIDFVDQEGWDYTLLFSSAADVTQAFGINQIPYIYLLDMNHAIVFEVAGWMQGDLLGQEIAQLFTVGINEHNTLKDIQVYGVNNNLIVNMETVQPELKISIYTIGGKMLFHSSYHNHSSNRLSIDIGNLSIGSIVFVKIETSEGEFITKKVMVK